MKDYSQLRKAAERAVPGTNVYASVALGSMAAQVLDLVTEIDTLREFKQHMTEMREVDGFSSWAEALVAVDKLRKEVEVLRKDAERYRWLMSDAVWNGTLGVRDGWIDFQFKDEAQEQIDYCMREDSGHD